MLKTLRKYAMIVGALVALTAPAALAPAAVYAQGASCGDAADKADIASGLKCGTCLDVNNPDCADITDETANTKINEIIKLVINIFSLVVGVVSVIMIIVGGLKYITSAGDSSNVTSAKNTILYAIIGLVVVALAQFIVRFVLAKVSPAA